MHAIKMQTESGREISETGIVPQFVYLGQFWDDGKPLFENVDIDPEGLDELPDDTVLRVKRTTFDLNPWYFRKEPSNTGEPWVKLGDMRDVIEQLPYEELLAQWNRAEADTLSSFFKETAANYTDDPNQVDLYQGYRISDLGQLDDLASSCRAMLHMLDNAAYSDDDKSADVISRAIKMNLPVPFEMLKQPDFRDYRAFLERTAQFVEPILKLDRLYPDPIMFRLTW